MTHDDRVRIALARLAETDAPPLLAEVRREAAERARERLVAAYADAIVQAVIASVREPAPAGGSGSRPPASETGDPLPASSPGEQGCYVYAVVAGDGAGAVNGATGVDERGVVDVVTGGGVSAVISDIDVQEMRDAGASGDVTEGGWLARAVRAHERVVMTAFRSAPTLPMRFGVVYPDRECVAGILRDHEAELHEELRKIAGAAEWTVKVYADTSVLRHRLDEAPDDAPEAYATGDRGGTAFLMRQRARRQLDDRVETYLTARVEGLATSLGARAQATAEVPTARPQDNVRVLMGTAFLVAKTDEDRFAALVADFGANTADMGITVHLDGPLPPYHFTRPRLGGSDG